MQVHGKVQYYREMMDIALVILFGVLTVLVFYLLKMFQQVRSELQTQASQLQQAVSQRFDANVQAVTGHLGIITAQITNTTNVVGQVEGKLGQMQEATRQIFDLARQISSLPDGHLDSAIYHCQQAAITLTPYATACAPARLPEDENPRPPKAGRHPQDASASHLAGLAWAVHAGVRCGPLAERGCIALRSPLA